MFSCTKASDVTKLNMRSSFRIMLWQIQLMFSSQIHSSYCIYLICTILQDNNKSPRQALYTLYIHNFDGKVGVRILVETRCHFRGQDENSLV